MKLEEKHRLFSNGGTLATVLRFVLGGTGAGMTVALIIMLVKLIEANPAAAWRIVEQWGPVFTLALVGLVLVDRRFGQFIETTQKSSAAMQELASSVHQMAEKDDRRAQATEAAVGFVAQQNEEILSRLKEIKDSMPQKSSLPGGDA